MERLARAALAASLSILLVAGAAPVVAQTSAVDLATLQAEPWTLSELDGQSVPADAGITAQFAEDGSLTGFGGCNQYTSDYTVADDTLTVGPIAATRKACEPDVTSNENLFLDLLQNASTWGIDSGVLTITAADGGTLVFGDVPVEPASFTGTEWTLANISGQPIAAGITATATFSEDGKVTGNAGCNRYNGPYTRDADTVTIGPLAATRKACDRAVMDVENAFLNGLEASTDLLISGNTLTLSSAAAGVELVLTTGAVGPTPTAVAPAPFVGTTWGLVDLDGTAVDPAAGISVTFGDDGSVSGFGGCNQLFGSYTTDGSALTVADLAATRKFCGQDVMDQESELITSLGNAESLAIAGDTLTIDASDGSSLTFKAGAAGPVPTEPPPPTPEPTIAPIETAAPTEEPTTAPETAAPVGGVVGPTWQLTELMGQAMPVGFVNVTITFNADGTVTGNGGCNDFSGTYTLEGDTIALAGITPGTGDCDATLKSIEDGLLQILPFVDSAKVENGELHLDSSFGIQTVWTPAG